MPIQVADTFGLDPQLNNLKLKKLTNHLALKSSQFDELALQEVLKEVTLG